jgi:DNA repair exonuclease SbcCD ATPase subunit
LKNTNKNILSTRNEINMWKKCIDDKNLLIQELRDEIRKKEEDLVKGQGRKRKESEEEEPEVRHLNQIILIKDKELKELKEKGQEYYAQADEALESQRKEIEIFTKRITALQGESKRLKEELKLSLKDRETMLEELKRLKSEEFRSHKEKEENRRQILQLREEKTKLLLELSKENEHPKGKSTEKVRMENIALKNQIEKLTQDLYLNRDSQNFSSRYREAGDKNLKVENEKQAEEIRNLTANLSKLTDFIFSLPGVSISSEETSLVESAIKVVKQLSQQSPDDSLKPDKAKFKSSLGQYYAMINKRQ